ncbi:MAG TPA: creatininase family protein [Opitutaceae bacterium]|nr:creatininase family protein [Opitutaceae bacterium]
MKPSSVFLAENTNLEIEEFLKKHHTIFIPVGAMEQHGPHSAIGTDVFLPQEIARRVCVRLGHALVAPPLAYTLSYPHRGFTSEFSLTIETFMAVVRDLALSFGAAGFKRIVFLNGHYDNTYALAYACAQADERLPKGAKAFPFNYWDGLTPEQFMSSSEGGKGLHAGEGEVSMLLAINPALVDMEKANAEFPNFPETITKSPALHTAFFFSSPGSVYRMSKTGTWGDARKATAAKGEQFLEAGVQSVINLMADLEKTFRELPVR